MLLKFNVDSPFVSRSDQKIGKNIFEFREKYFRISKSIDRSTPDSDFLEELPKSGENSVLWKIFLKDWIRVDG